MFQLRSCTDLHADRIVIESHRHSTRVAGSRTPETKNKTTMKLNSPFIISSRLAPAVQIGRATLSFVDGQFIIDLPDGTEHVVEDFNFPLCRIAGATDESVLQDGFASMLAFLGACAESRAYAARQRKDPMDGENSGLFPANVGEWAESVSDELAMLQIEIEETKNLITN
jgi:hypothetical protein